MSVDSSHFKNRWSHVLGEAVQVVVGDVLPFHEVGI